MNYNIAGIQRRKEYSPNHIETDTLIFMKTVEELEKLGIKVNIYHEEESDKIDFSEKVIFTMAKGLPVVNNLLKKQNQGSVIINSPTAVTNCYRVNMSRLFTANHIPFPKSIIVNTNDNCKYKISDFGSNKIWIKRGDVHAVHREDVSLVYSDDEKNTVLKEFSYRGIDEVILQQHIDGDVVKFYSVKGTDFFYWYYLNGIYHTPFDENELKKISNDAANVMKLDVFGGDAIVSQDGKITIIDINDWPSFAPIRDEASKHIAQLISERTQKKINEKLFEHTL